MRQADGFVEEIMEALIPLVPFWDGVEMNADPANRRLQQWTRSTWHRRGTRSLVPTATTPHFLRFLPCLGTTSSKTST